MKRNTNAGFILHQRVLKSQNGDIADIPTIARNKRKNRFKMYTITFLRIIICKLRVR